ncbi:hypothetical protein [Paenibacillus sp. MER 99-2]|uniref:hypothetical protein n=1 Tax=Paenibacillus sp. MER 99-2 TaxID=2939572 RepID=UPI00203DB643|nr:hypothetical protein [Paenibacillus sp. MER 99-2]MCM3176240.1 hypothetical protein [Paenibacillus sp. MER 99-2]
MKDNTHVHIEINTTLNNMYLPNELLREGKKIMTVISAKYNGGDHESYNTALMFVNMGIETYKLNPNWEHDLIKLKTNAGDMIFGVLYSVKSKVEKVNDFKDFINKMDANELCDILEQIQSKYKQK